MRCLRLVWRSSKLVFLALIGWLAVHGPALAREPQQKQADSGGGSYVLPYAIVILTIAVGLLLVCRASRRRDRARPEQYDSSKTGVSE